MESVLIILFGITVIILIVSSRSEVLKKIDIVNKNVATVYKQIKALQVEVPAKELVKEAKLESKLEESPLKNNALEVSFQRPVSVTPEIKEEVKPVEEIIIKEEPKVMMDKLEAAISGASQTQKISKEKVSTAFHGGDSLTKEKKSYDYEKLIGENWLNKIGIAVLVIGIGFFVKYAIDKNWIGEWGRLSIGVGTAFLMIAIAHRLRTTYHAFSSVLIGGGIATLYYTISIGYHDYQLFSQPAAFAIMTAITLLAMVMAIWYDRKELAIIGLVGGFSAPFMVAGETNNAMVFFTYIAILNAGMLGLSFFKKWIVLNRLAFAFTSIYLTFWIISAGMSNVANRQIALIFLIVFFAQFLAMNLIYNVKRNVKFNEWEFVHLFSISGLFYGGAMYVLGCMGQGDMQGFFTLMMGLLFVTLALVLKQIPTVDKNLVYLLIGKAVTFITLMILVQFDGHYKTLFWALETVVLLWMGQKAKIDLLKRASVLLTLIATFALFIDWATVYGNYKMDMPIVFNQIFSTGFFVLLSYCGTIYLLKNESEETTAWGFKLSHFRSLLIGWFFVVLYLVMLFELLHQIAHVPYKSGQIQAVWIYHFVFIGIALMIAWQRKNALAKQVFFALGNVALVLYLAIGHQNNVVIRDNVFSSNLFTIFYQFHFLLVALFAGIIFGLRKISLTMLEEKKQVDIFLVLLSIYGIFILTAELDMIAVHSLASNMIEKSTILKHTQIAGYTVLWGIYSFALMIFGMRQKIRFVRIFSLVVFSITLLKLFVFDITNISEGGKIIAFISLGVMLLVISFLYQKLKKIIVDGEVS